MIKIKCRKNQLFILILAIALLFLTHFSRAAEGVDFQVPAPRESTLIEENTSTLGASGNAKTFIYKSSLDQDTIKNEYKAFFQKQGFKYRKDKEAANKVMQYLRFDREDLLIDITLLSFSNSGTKVTITKYPPNSALLDMKEVFSFDPSKIKLPDFNRGNNPDTEFSSDALNFEIPPAPESELLDGKLPEVLTGKNGKGVTYFSKSSPEVVAYFYKEFFRGQGFQAQPDRSFKMGNTSRMRFERKDLAIALFLTLRNGGCDVIIIKYPGADGGLPVIKDPFSTAVLPKEDNPSGSDLEDIPRPEKSVRTVSNTSANTTTLSYLVPMPPEEARDFYLQQMPSLGWDLTGQIDIGKASDDYMEKTNKPSFIPSAKILDLIDMADIIKKSYLLDFKSSEASARVTISPNFLGQKEGAMVGVLYNKNARD